MLEELDILEGAPHASTGNAMRRPTRHVYALEHDHASRRPQQARDNIEQGGFAGPIRSNQRGNRPLRDLETCPVQSGQPTKVFVEILHDQHRLGTFRSKRSVKLQVLSFKWKMTSRSS